MFQKIKHQIDFKNKSK